MTFSYLPSEMRPLDKVRILVQDKDPANPQFQDEEILFFLSLRSSIYGAASEACTARAGIFAALADQKAGDHEIKYAQAARGFTQLAQLYNAKAAQSGAGMPYVGGISVSDKANSDNDEDMVLPEFARDMFDNNLPLGQLTPRAPSTGGDGN